MIDRVRASNSYSNCLLTGDFQKNRNHRQWCCWATRVMESMKHATLVLSSCQNSNLGFLCRIESRHVSTSSAAAANYKYVLCYKSKAFGLQFLSMVAIESFLVQSHTQRVQNMMIQVHWRWWWSSPSGCCKSSPSSCEFESGHENPKPVWRGVIAELCGRCLSVLISPPIWEQMEKEEAR